MSGMVLFGIPALVTLVAAFLVVTTRKMVHAALWLVLALFGGAVIFVLLQAAFLAVAQVVIYIGAIAVLMIFAVMLTRRIGEEDMPPVNEHWPIAALLSGTLFIGLVFFYLNAEEVRVTAPALDPDFDMLTVMGQELLSPSAFVLPFELASVLLLAALIGSIVVAWKD